MSAVDLIDAIRQKERERQYCLDVLDLWARTADQGIDINTVKSFGFDEKLLAAADRSKREFAVRLQKPDPFVARMPNGSYKLLAYNYVRHFDGSQTTLNPPLKAPHEPESVVR